MSLLGQVIRFNVIRRPGGGGGGEGGGGGGVLPYTENVIRIFGLDRYQTAVAISKHGWSMPLSGQSFLGFIKSLIGIQSTPVYSKNVVVATGENFPDALAGSALAGVYDCPILLTESQGLNYFTRDEINRLGATNCFILGETGAVSETVKNQIIAQTGADNVVRVGGIDRYETAKLIAQKVKEKRGMVDTAIIATGENFPDALAASSLAGYKHFPILLVTKDYVPTATKQALLSLNIQRTIVVGGNDVISESVKASLPAAFRLAGVTRYGTATEIAKFSKHNFGLANSTILIATGENFPDALTGGAHGARTGLVIVLTQPLNLDGSPETKAFITGFKGEKAKGIIFGGPVAVSDTVLYQTSDAI